MEALPFICKTRTGAAQLSELVNYQSKMAAKLVIASFNGFADFCDSDRGNPCTPDFVTSDRDH